MKHHSLLDFARNAVQAHDKSYMHKLLPASSNLQIEIMRVCMIGRCVAHRKWIMMKFVYHLNTINQSWSNSLTAGPNITDCRASSFQLLGCSLIYQPCALKQRNLMPYATLQVLAPC